MSTLATLALLVVPALVLFLLGCARARAGGEPQAGPGGASDDALADTGQRERIARQLEELAAAEPPADLSAVGAMCYEVAAPPERAEYVCPACGERTVYGRDEATLVETEIPACRRAVDAIPELRVTLDESPFCRKCSPDVDKPRLALAIRFEGAEEPTRIEGVRLQDLQLLREFLAGADRHRGEYDQETALRDHVSRLRELLGFPAHWTRAETEAQLAELAATPPPTDLNQIGAMCYKPAGPPDRAEYACPVCGERTVYSDRHAWTVQRDLPACRRLIASLPLLDLTLDERSFCRKCSPEVTDPTLTLVVRYEDGRAHRTKGIDPQDLVLLREFEGGSLEHEGPMGEETPLIAHRARIEELLGLGARAPREPIRNAMCYAAPPRPQSTSYLCPECGERTLYPTAFAGFFERELPTLRRTGEPVDESVLCRHCRPEAHGEEAVAALSPGHRERNAPA